MATRPLLFSVRQDQEKEGGRASNCLAVVVTPPPELYHARGDARKDQNDAWIR
jgi:hypothetical protein